MYLFLTLCQYMFSILYLYKVWFSFYTMMGKEGMSLEARKMESLQPDHDWMAFSLLCNRSDLISSLRIYLYILYSSSHFRVFQFKK